MGVIPAYNLTPAGPLANWSDADIYRAIRYNVDPNGRRLVVMSAIPVSRLSEEDTHAVIAYLRSQPATGSETRQEQPSLVMMAMSGAGLVPMRTYIDQTPHVAAGSTAEYGEYMLGFLGCGDCHGDDLRGGQAGGFTPVGPSLTANAPGWTAEQFITAIRTGVRPSAPPMSDEMPWKTYKNLDDTELGAIHAYLVSLNK